MAIQPATRLGPFEVLSAIGAGGKGEVFKVTPEAILPSFAFVFGPTRKD
jgi:hypothetical protein